MGRVILIFVALIVVVVLAGGAWLAFQDIPAPTHKVEKVVPDDRLQN